MGFTNSGIPLLYDSNDKHSSSLFINERNQLLDNELGENQSACISCTADSLVDLDNGSSMERDEMVGKGKETSEAQSSFNDSVFRTLIYHFWKSFSLYKAKVEAFLKQQILP